MSGPGYGCALGDDTHQVNWLITRIRPAVTISLCDDDFPVGIIPVLASELGVDGGRLYDTIKRFVDREQAREDKEHAQAAAAAVDAAPPGPDESPDEPPGGLPGDDLEAGILSNNATIGGGEAG